MEGHFNGASPDKLYPKADVQNPKLEVLKSLVNTRKQIEINLESPKLSADNKAVLRGTLLEIESQLKALKGE